MLASPLQVWTDSRLRDAQRNISDLFKNPHNPIFPAICLDYFASSVDVTLTRGPLAYTGFVQQLADKWAGSKCWTLEGRNMIFAVGAAAATDNIFQRKRPKIPFRRLW